jgi:hypothetical protein
MIPLEDTSDEPLGTPVVEAEIALRNAKSTGFLGAIGATAVGASVGAMAGIATVPIRDMPKYQQSVVNAARDNIASNE